MSEASAASTPAPSPARKTKSRRKMFIILGIFVVVVIIAAIVAKKTRGEPPIQVTTEKAVIKTITQLVTATGKVQPETEVRISPEVAGELIEIAVKEGQSVRRGDLLVRIKPDFYQAQLEQQQAALASAKAASVLSGARLAKAEQDFKQADELYAKKLISDAEHIAARQTSMSRAPTSRPPRPRCGGPRAPSSRPRIRSPRPPSIHP
jgi:HlyD family secretion protein